MKLIDDIPTDEQRFSYLTPLDQVQLGEGNTSWIHAAPLGEYKHPLYGKISFTKDRIARFVEGVKSKVRGIDLAIDYNHRSGQEAAGWIRDAENRSTGLWLLIEWTERAANAIRSKEYRYFSPEFANTYTDPKSSEVHRDVLIGGGLTNRPFLKDLVPVNLSEVYDDVDTEEESESNESEQEDNSVSEFAKTLRKQLGLPEDATDEQVLAATTAKDTGAQPDPQMSELIAQVTSLTELNAKLIAGRRIDGVNVQLKEWEAPTTNEAKFAMPPAVHDKMQTILLSENEALVEQVSEVFNELVKVGMVKLGEHETSVSGGREKIVGGNTGGDDAPETTKFEELVVKIQGENEGMSTADALEEAARQDPQAFEEYRQQTYTFREVGD